MAATATARFVIAHVPVELAERVDEIAMIYKAFASKIPLLTSGVSTAGVRTRGTIMWRAGMCSIRKVSGSLVALRQGIIRAAVRLTWHVARMQKRGSTATALIATSQKIARFAVMAQLCMLLLTAKTTATRSFRRLLTLVTGTRKDQPGELPKAPKFNLPPFRPGGKEKCDEHTKQFSLD